MRHLFVHTQQSCTKSPFTKYVPLIQAILDGKTIEMKGGGVWSDAGYEITLEGPASMYRIKVEVWVPKVVEIQRELWVEFYNEAPLGCVVSRKRPSTAIGDKFELYKIDLKFTEAQPF